MTRNKREKRDLRPQHQQSPMMKKQRSLKEKPDSEVKEVQKRREVFSSLPLMSIKVRKIRKEIQSKVDKVNRLKKNSRSKAVLKIRGRRNIMVNPSQKTRSFIKRGFDDARY